MSKRNRVCGNKTKHSSKNGAFIEARKVVKVGMNVYRCSECGYWHIGKTRNETRSSDRITALLEKHQRRLNKRMKENTWTLD